MQSVSSRTWSRVAVSIPYDDNHYTIMFDDLIVCKQMTDVQLDC